MVYLPVKPQWAPASIEPVEKNLNKGMVVFEWGTGCSTPWLAQRVKHVFAMDHDENWMRRAEDICIELGIKNVDFSVYPENDQRYLEAIYWFSEMGGIDLAIVDGVAREESFMYAVRFVKKGGLILLDDSQRIEYQAAFQYRELTLLWTRGTQQTTTLFRKV